MCLECPIQVIELGGPLPSAPLPAEWKNISPHITHSPKLDGSCCERHLAETQRSKPEGPGSGPQEKRLLLQSSEWAQLREEREAVRKRFGAREFAARPRGPGTRTTSMTAAFGSSASKLGQPLYLGSEGKASSGRASRIAGRGAPHTVGPSGRTQSFHAGQESRTPVGPAASLRSSSSEVDSPITPFVITDTGSTTSSFSYQGESYPLGLYQRPHDVSDALHASSTLALGLRRISCRLSLLGAVQWW